MNVAFHASSGSVHDWRHALTNVRNLLADDTVDADSVTLVANGDAVYAVTEGSPVAEKVSDLVGDGVRVVACRNSLHARDVDPESLVRGVDVVPSGVGELATRQAAGDAYLKVP